MARIIIASASTGRQLEVEQAQFDEGFFAGWYYVSAAPLAATTEPTAEETRVAGYVSAGGSGPLPTALRAGYVAQIGAASGVNDTATINGLLASAGVVRGTPGQTYLISAPLVVKSGTVLDMTGCTVRLISASNCNMLNNAAVASVRRVLDAVTTAASTTLTSATAAFVSGDVGKAITVQGAGAAGVPLTTTIASVTNGTTAVLAAAAGTSVTGQYAAIGTRDSDITVRGGLWDRQNNGDGTTYNGHTLRFRHVDKLTVENLEVASTAGKYGINPGDCTDVRAAGITFRSQSSDGVHLNGPCARVEIRDIIGDTMGDDLVSLTAHDTYSAITDCAGDITDITIDNVMYRSAQTGGSLTSAVLKIVAGQNTTQNSTYKVARVFARSLIGPAVTSPVVVIGDVSGDVGGNGGTFADITLDGVRSLGGGGNSKATISLVVGSMDGITLRDLRPHPDDIYAVQIAAPVDRLLIDGLRWDPTGTFAYGVNIASTVTRAVVRNVQANLGATGNNRLIVVGSGGTLSRLVLDGAQVSATADGEVIFNAAGVLGSVHVVGGHFSGISYPLGTYRDGSVLTAHSIYATGLAGWFQVLSGAYTHTVAGVSGLYGDKAGYTAGAGATVKILPRGSSGIDPDPDFLSVGEETLDRRHVTDFNTMPSGNMILTYFTARKTETINNVRTEVAGTAAAGTTLARIGIYSVDGSGNHTLVASSANDTTLWNSSYSGATKALSAAWSKSAGQRYAVGVLFVGTTAPALRSVLPASGAEAGLAPRINGNLTGQTDLPATFGTPSSGNGISVFAVVTP